MGDMAGIEDNIIKKSIFPQFFYRLNKLPIILLSVFIIDIGKPIQKFICKCK